ncbi:hypothetical protein K9U39_07045 [Rhodoblastus acidophilus]|uniref:Uncharacterized protein n=1 Tax=Candidatus Rhodoblastus alkanivorans TaxID=2954117 RepID=A0ABS9Z6W9_9HYPH|nr:hypothetical protein [Candidatus Rhodoblastus alkanivorans]MCI4680139.1 hypothetical protein [Candidatus Rhodoblastus alkanivorans]MCI4683393.1 hypothetical protein [Candidatus Rhodoblastus alkanivorans]MDI4640703.1 hypothetical protein [Rhodoblastus acidophilus]
MSIKRYLGESNRGSAVDRLALFCAVVSVVSVLGAHGLDKLAQNGDLPVIAFSHSGARPDIDYSATASIPNRAARTQLNPCGQTFENR